MSTWKRAAEMFWWCICVVSWFFAVVGSFCIADISGPHVGEIVALVLYPMAIVVSFIGGFALVTIYDERKILEK